MSNVIKSNYYQVLGDSKEILVKQLQMKNEAVEEDVSELKRAIEEELKEAKKTKEEMLRDAEALAEETVRSAFDEAQQMKLQAQEEIEAWWNEKRELDEQTQEHARLSGYEQGYQEGEEQARQEVLASYQTMLDEAKQIVEQAALTKQQVIQESEPFLIELSCSIAEKVIGHQLSIEKGWIIELVQRTLQRRREQGIITLCVAPSNYSFIQNARDELQLSIDSQAELQIIPDATVRDFGCVVRSSFGSIDARVDTQLNEIKKALQQIAAQSEEG
ncbi:flagellar assembly protein FliH [Paenibacillus sp. y28]|uniref:flagellar assembly protein FliH n=1 Tax=Paenibacillus sp. y28 TaxID=3129110 RepID=UPI003017FD76